MKFVFGCFVLVVVSIPAYAKELVISYVSHPHMQRYITLIQSAYDDIGIPVRFVDMPVGRRIIELHKGMTDADVSAQEWFSEGYENVLKVQPPLSSIVIYLTCQSDIPCYPEIIYDDSKKLFIDSGMLSLLKHSLQYEPHNNVILLDRIDVLSEMQVKGRIEYFVWSADREQAIPRPIKNNLDVIVIGNANIYHHVHVRHKHMINKLSQSLSKNLDKLTDDDF